MSITVLVRIDEVVVSNRIIAAKTEKVDALAGSISELGLLQPIVISDDRRLIAGLHRLKACQSLGWVEVPALIIDHADKRAELAEVDENLVRNNLTALEEGELLIKRKAIYEELYPSTKRGVAGAKAKHAKAAGDSATAVPSFAADTAAKTGQSERNVQNKIAAVSKLPEDIREAIRDTAAANNVAEMKRLSKYNEQPELLKKIVAAIQNKEAATVSRAARISRPPLSLSPKEELEELRKGCRRVDAQLAAIEMHTQIYGDESVEDLRPYLESWVKQCEGLLSKIDNDTLYASGQRAA